jgi:hypothetical protein
VLDASGAAIPNAHVEITETATNRRQETSTTNTGDYVFTHLDPGPYRLDVTAPGFEHLTRNANYKQAASPTQIASVDLTLNTGSAAETVTVVADAASIQTGANGVQSNLPAVSKTIEAQRIPDVPTLNVPTLDVPTPNVPLPARDTKAAEPTRQANALAYNDSLKKMRPTEANKSAGKAESRPDSRPAAGFATGRLSATASTHTDIQLQAARARELSLPNGQKPIATAASANLILAIDSDGALQLSNDAGKTWQPIPQQWTGRLVAIRTMPIVTYPSPTPGPAQNPAGGQSSAAPAPQTPLAQFEITTDHHTVFTSPDGHIWKPK